MNIELRYLIQWESYCKISINVFAYWMRQNELLSRPSSFKNNTHHSNKHDAKALVGNKTQIKKQKVGTKQINYPHMRATLLSLLLATLIWHWICSNLPCIWIEIAVQWIISHAEREGFVCWLCIRVYVAVAICKSACMSGLYECRGKRSSVGNTLW